MSNCPDCTHPKTDHSPMVGCLRMARDAEGTAHPESCDCDRSFREDKPREQMTAERDQAMGQAQQGTDPDWEAKATQVVHALAQSGQDFTPDTVWVKLEEQRVAPPREPRALGPILKRLAKADVIRAKGFTESHRRHGAPVRIYEAGPRP